MKNIRRLRLPIRTKRVVGASFGCVRSEIRRDFWWRLFFLRNGLAGEVVVVEADGGDFVGGAADVDDSGAGQW